MAYIGNGRTLVVLGPNVRDNIAPGYNNPLNQYPQDGPYDKSTFELSQEVPGGYAENVYVFKKTNIVETLITNTTLISIVSVNSTTFKLLCTDDPVASVLSSVRESLKQYSEEDHYITISGATDSINNGSFIITSISYTGTQIEIFLKKTGSGQITSVGTQTLTIKHEYSGFWEVLEAEVDYTISGSGSTLNKLINFTKIPQNKDEIYVIHSGDATYNLVPSPGSVGPDQLSHNLRNFKVDRYTGNNVTLTYALSQFAVSSKSLLVTVNGTILDGDDPEATPSFNGDWALAANGLSITFDTAPALNAKIKILHLGYSTVSRRDSLSPGQTGGLPAGSVSISTIQNGAVTTPKIADNAVTNIKIHDGAVNSDKILLANNTALRSLKVDGITSLDLIKLDSSGITLIDSENGVSFLVNSTKILNLTSTQLSPEITSTVSLGSSTKKFKDLFLSGNSTIDGSLTVSGNATITGTLSGPTITQLNSTLSSLTTKVNNLVPIGTILFWPKDTEYDTNWKICDGTTLNTFTYKELHAVVSNTFGGTAYQAGVTDQSGATTTFNLPDLRRRIAVGRLAGTDNIGNNEGVATASSRVWTHTHTGAPHTHDLSNHTHSIPAHYHGMGTGATLNITSSGSHTTTIDISHSHTATCSNSSAAISSTTANISLVDPGHSHGCQGMNQNLTHTHSGTTNLDGAHSHDIREALSASSGTLIAQSVRRDNYYTTSGIVRSDGSEHQHSFTTNSANINHSHTINSNTTGCYLTQSVHGHTDSGHNHTISVSSLPTTNRTHTGGTHVHSSSNFSGLIGLVTGGVDGNASMTSGVPSNNNTGAATYTGQTGSASVPYMILNYVIKVKDVYS